MIITILEGHVAPENQVTLESEYLARIAHLDAGIVATSLVQSVKDSTLWMIQTTWRDRQALEEMRRTASTPTGVLIFRAAGAEPVLTIYEIRAQAEA